MSTKIKGVIFDLDGTLLDSLQGIVDAMNGILAEKNYPLHDSETYKYFVGEGLVELVRRALPDEWYDGFDSDAVMQEALDVVVSDYRALYDKVWPDLSPPYEGITDVLDTFTENNVKMAVLSNKSDDFTKRMVKQLLPSWEFETVLGARQGVPRKPDPGTALEIAELMALSPGEMAFIGDTMIDIKTAVNAGMLPVGVLWGFREEKELRDNGAKLLLKSPLELTTII